MSRAFSSNLRTLAVDLFARGFGFAVIEGSGELIDWGIKSARTNKQVTTLKRMVDLQRAYVPDVLVCERHEESSNRRKRRVRTLLLEIQGQARASGVRTYSVTRSQIRRHFARLGATTKHQVSRIVALEFQELVPYLPPARKSWQGQDQRMRIFGAVALILVFSARQRNHHQGRNLG